MFGRPGLPSFDYVRARTAKEVVDLLGEQKGTAQLLMGGTDLFPRMRDGLARPGIVVDVKHVPGMREIRYDEGSGLTCGAAVTLNQLARHPDVRAHYPVLVEAATSIASYQLRNRATLGGNVCNASPAADTAPAILVLDGSMVLRGPDGVRTVPAREFFLEPGQTATQMDEFLTAIRFPILPSRTVSRYVKLGRNKRGDLSIVGVAVLGIPDDVAASGYRFAIALASVAPVPLKATAAEALLATHPCEEQSFVLAAEKAMQSTSPIDDVRSSAAYRRAMVRSLTLRTLREVWEELRAERPAA